MSLTKRYLDDIQADEEMREWIIERGSLFMEEGDEEWQSLQDEYENRIDFPDDDDWDYESEITWTKKQKAYDSFHSQILDVKNNLKKGSSGIVLKMNYSFAVTLMESCLGDMLRGIILSNTHYLENAIKNVPELKNAKFSLIDFYNNDDFVTKFTLQKLAKDYSYHHIQKTVSLYENVIGEPLSKSVSALIADMKDIIDVRHDIVHRNGFTTDETEHDLSYSSVNKAINTITQFVTSIKQYTDAAEAKRIFS